MPKPKTICKECGIPISKNSISKHIRKNRCSLQHIREDERNTKGFKKKGKGQIQKRK